MKARCWIPKKQRISLLIPCLVPRILLVLWRLCYFLIVNDNTQEKINWRNVGFIQLRLRTRSTMVGKARSTGQWSVVLSLQSGSERDERWCSAHLIAFILSRTTPHGIVPPIFNMALLTSIWSNLKSLSQAGLKAVSMVILTPRKLTINIDYLDALEVCLGDLSLVGSPCPWLLQWSLSTAVACAAHR